jgi:hypothetical protein
MGHTRVAYSLWRSHDLMLANSATHHTVLPYTLRQVHNVMIWLCLIAGWWVLLTSIHTQQRCVSELPLLLFGLAHVLLRSVVRECIMPLLGS